MRKSLVLEKSSLSGSVVFYGVGCIEKLPTTVKPRYNDIALNYNPFITMHLLGNDAMFAICMLKNIAYNDTFYYDKPRNTIKIPRFSLRKMDLVFLSSFE